MLVKSKSKAFGWVVVSFLLSSLFWWWSFRVPERLPCVVGGMPAPCWVCGTCSVRSQGPDRESPVPVESQPQTPHDSR